MVISVSNTTWEHFHPFSDSIPYSWAVAAPRGQESYQEFHIIYPLTKVGEIPALQSLLASSSEVRLAPVLRKSKVLRRRYSIPLPSEEVVLPVMTKIAKHHRPFLQIPDGILAGQDFILRYHSVWPPDRPICSLRLLNTEATIQLKCRFSPCAMIHRAKKTRRSSDSWWY